MKKLLSTFIFTIMIFLTLLSSVFAFLYLIDPKTSEKVYTPTFLTGESLTFLLINIFIYLLLFNVWSLYLKGKERGKETLTINLEEDNEQKRRDTKELYKERWQNITEILEEKSHHSLLNEFKIHELRASPYMKKSLNITLKSSFKLNRIINIYHKIYNTIMPLKDREGKSNTNELMLFLKGLIKNLQTVNLKIILFIIKRAWKYYFYFMISALGTFAVFSYWIGNFELFSMNLFILLSLFTLLSVSYAYFEIKSRIYSNFIFHTSYFSHYLNKFTFVSMAFLVSISSLLALKFTIFTTGNFNHYNDLTYTFGKLLLPSSFKKILESSSSYTPFEILLYKLIFIFVLGYIVFNSINFAIKKYDSIYFSNTKKTLMPPELATLSINFLLVILFLSLLYGTFFNYIHIMDYTAVLVDTQGGVEQNITQVLGTSNTTGEMTDYIPFSIFIAIVGGLLTMATKDLLENYFAGLSLQMDSPYEEHDRVTIDGSEMLEVRHIGIRADKFYGIKSNAEIIIPHQQIIKETIINYTLPTLDYREEISIHIPQVNNNMSEEYRSIPKRAEMLLLLSIYVNTGVKIPFLQISETVEKEDSLNGLHIRAELEAFRAIANMHKDKQLVAENKTGNTNMITYGEYEAMIETESNCIEKLWGKLKEENKNYETKKFDHPLSKLFIQHLIETVETAIIDKDQNNEPKEKKIIFKIKSIVASVLLSIDDYQKKSSVLYHHIDKNFARRKYRMFRETDGKGYDKDSIQNMANELVHINYYYFILADSLWKLKNLQNSLYRKREVDATSIELLDVPRVTTEHIYSGEGKINYWKVTANITLELAEQSNEIIHHIHMYVDNLWNDFNLPKYYEIRAE